MTSSARSNIDVGSENPSARGPQIRCHVKFRGKLDEGSSAGLVPFDRPT